MPRSVKIPFLSFQTRARVHLFHTRVQVIILISQAANFYSIVGNIK